MNRRHFIQLNVLASGALATSSRLSAQMPATKQSEYSFPKGFLWGASTAAHQVEGGNVNSDYWLLEHLPNSPFKEPSLDTCDHYHRYRDDIRLLSELRLNCYRFSIEWARVEPEKGHFSNAALAHYQDMIDACLEQGVKPVVTFHHFTCPRWFAAQGGWENPESIELFARYCERLTRYFGDRLDVVCTINELNFTAQLDAKNFVPRERRQAVMQNAARAMGVEHFSAAPLGDPELISKHILQAHIKGREAIKSVKPDLSVGMTLTMIDWHSTPEGQEKLNELRHQIEDRFLEVAKHDDFVGVQAYTREFVDRDGFMPMAPGVQTTQMGYEYWPKAVESAVRRAHKITSVPVYITENGVGTEDDQQRIDYIQGALEGVVRCLQDGIDIRSYIHWTLLDNFEWTNGYEPKFGLVSVDTKTFQRTPKASATYLGNIATVNRFSVGG